LNNGTPTYSDNPYFPSPNKEVSSSQAYYPARYPGAKKFILKKSNITANLSPVLKTKGHRIGGTDEMRSTAYGSKVITLSEVNESMVKENGSLQEIFSSIERKTPMPGEFRDIKRLKKPDDPLNSSIRSSSLNQKLKRKVDIRFVTSVANSEGIKPVSSTGLARKNITNIKKAKFDYSENGNGENTKNTIEQSEKKLKDGESEAKKKKKKNNKVLM